jgi:hypothetical protein
VDKSFRRFQSSKKKLRNSIFLWISSFWASSRETREISNIWLFETQNFVNSQLYILIFQYQKFPSNSTSNFSEVFWTSSNP